MKLKNLKKIETLLRILVLLGSLSFPKMPLRNEKETVNYIFAQNVRDENMCILWQNNNWETENSKVLQ